MPHTMLMQPVTWQVKHGMEVLTYSGEHMVTHQVTQPDLAREVLLLLRRAAGDGGVVHAELGVLVALVAPAVKLGADGRVRLTTG